jgi:hypothetical protein
MKNLIFAIFLMVTHLSYLYAAEESLLLGVDEVKASIAQHQPKKTILIIGVRPGEQEFHERYNHLLTDLDTFPVFADKYPAVEPLIGHFLQGNFDNVAILQKIGNEFPDTFGIITFDGVDTTKHLQNAAKHLDMLYPALKLGGTLFFHDHFSLDFSPEGDASIVLSAEEFYQWEEILPTKLGDTFKKLPPFSLPSSISDSSKIDESEIENLVNTIMPLIESYTPQRFIETANALMKLGLENSGGLLGKPYQGFVVKSRKEIGSRLRPFLRKKKFIEENISSMMEAVKNVQKSFLQEKFKDIEVVSQDSDEENSRIFLRPRESGAKYIIYKVRK